MRTLPVGELESLPARVAMNTFPFHALCSRKRRFFCEYFICTVTPLLPSTVISLENYAGRTDEPAACRSYAMHVLSTSESVNRAIDQRVRR